MQALPAPVDDAPGVPLKYRDDRARIAGSRAIVAEVRAELRLAS